MSLLPVAILFMTQCFVLLRVLLPLSFFFTLLSLAAAVVVAVSLLFSQTQRNISINGAMLESSSSFSSQVFHFFVSSSLLFLLFLMHVGFSSSTLMSLSLPSPWFLCSEIVFGLLVVVRPSSLLLSPFSRLLTVRCDEFFVCHFFICSSTSSSTSWYLMNLRLPLWHIFYHDLAFD